MAPQRARDRSLEAIIEYAIVALGLSATQIATVIKNVAGVTVDPKCANFLQDLDEGQLGNVWNRLSEDPGWKKHVNAF
jgi:hypothetical protein